ncbi:class I SAM-dependent methyltransferase [Paraglaciecola sp.]|uniref:class I SAM-dependent methyltransferase n=1 Tax=Paraglaciecola sp. TaxID=1920173 RepID=UPI003EF84B04
MHDHDHDIEAEAEAFNSRITERSQAGFIADLRRNVRCEYFYKSFWRDPKFTDLYVGEMNRNYLRLVSQNLGPNQRILDVGCGAGYFSLELAREGHYVTGIDIADKAIDTAQKVLDQNPYKDKFGSLEYRVSSIEELLDSDLQANQYDAVLFSGVLHHLEDIDSILKMAKTLLSDGGIVLGHEPCHENWTQSDASVVALIRCLLALTNSWHEEIDELLPQYDESSLEQLVSDIKTEYVEERDKTEGGQSPHDNTFNGKQIIESVRANFDLLEETPSSSFIYRVLGGIRNNIETEHKLAEFLASFDKFGVKNKIINPNYFYFCARK